jgi:hypothetical protein
MPDNKNITEDPARPQPCTEANVTLHRKYFCKDVSPETACPTWDRATLVIDP